MTSPFDALQASVFGTVSATLGYEASWSPSAGGSAYTARVLFKAPSDDQRLAFVDYSEVQPFCEYYGSDFPGLKDAVEARSHERLVINGITYYVRKVEAIHDGRTFKATLVQDDGSL